MARTKISEFSATPGNNTDIDGINLAEGCAPSGINDAIRELMSQLKDFQAGTAGDSFNGPVGTTTAAAGAFTTLSASSTVSGAGFSNYLASPPAIGGTAAAAGSFTTLTTSSTVTHNGGTANGVAYLNGSKVLTTGSALTFDGTNFATTGSVQSTDFRQSGTGYITWNTSAGSNSLVFRDNANERMRIDSSGNLGIGTSSPTNYGAGYRTVSANGTSSGVFELQANGTAQAILVADNTDLQIQALGARPIRFFTNGNKRMELDSSGNLGLGVTPSAWQSTWKSMEFGKIGQTIAGFTGSDPLFRMGTNLYTNSSGTDVYAESGKAATQYLQYIGQHQWFTAPSGTAGNAISFTQAMTLTAAGDLGVGTTSPTARIHSNGTIQSVTGSTGIQIYGDGGTGYVNSIGAYPLVFQVNSTERARIDSSGNLGIGTSSPSQKLDVRGGVYLQDGNKYGAISATSSSGGQLYINTYSNQIWQIQGVEKMRLDSSGNLLVGNTTGTGKAYIETSSTTQTGQRINASSGSYTGNVLELYSATGGGSGWYLMRGYAASGSTSLINIIGNGNVANANNSYGAISDLKLKENIFDATPKLEKLKQVRIVNYNLIGSEQKQIGVIAQELEQVFPAMVEEIVDQDAEGNNLGTKTKSVKYSVFVPMLIKAIQEQQTIIEELKSRLDAANL